MIFNILLISVACVWWVNICPIIDIIKYFYKGRLKPIDCAMCLGFWSGLILAFVSHETILIAPLTSFLCVVIEKLYLILLRNAY